MGVIAALDRVTVSRGDAPVLRDVSMRLEAGERLAIVGPNGAGKTTLLRAIVGLQPVDAGEVSLFGLPCRGEKEFRRLRPRLGFLFQDSDDQLFCPTAIEDVAFGPLNTGCTPAEATARAAHALETLGIGNLAGRIVDRLSGGEKRLVCLAGLLAMNPEALLLDEPTNGVDAANLDRLREALGAFGGAMILVSHDAAFIAAFATRALVLDDGRLRPGEIHTHPHMHSHPHVHPAAGH